MIAEMEVEGEDLEAAAQAKLDHFRECTSPEEAFGIHLYRVQDEAMWLDFAANKLGGSK